MRNSTSARTPKTTKTVKDESSSTKSADAEKTSAKKLKQARLPFKVIAPGTSPVGSKASATKDADKDSNKDGVESKNGHNAESATTTISEGRKRKLSYDSDGDDGADCNKHNEADDNISKENVEVVAAVSKKKKIATSSDGTSDVIVSLLDDDESIDFAAETSTVVAVAATKDSSLKTPKAVVKEKRKGAGTPQTSSSSSAQKDKSGSASKLKIKLPLSAGKKNKRRKSKLLHLTANSSINEGGGGHNNSCAESSDDIEEVASQLNPLKRKKLDIEAKHQQDENDRIVKKQDVKIIALDSESEVEEDNSGDKQKVAKESSTAPTTLNQTEKKKSAEENEKVKSKDKPEDAKKEANTNDNAHKLKSTNTEKCPQENEDSKIKHKLIESKKDSKTNTDIEEDTAEEIAEISDSSDEEDTNEDKEDLNESIQSDNDNEADDERDNGAAKSINISSDMSEDSKSKHINTVDSLKDNDNASTSTKNLTPKQIKLMEQRRKAREEKERKLQEEKMKKQHEKEERELAKKREREEKEEHKKKEREEKEEQKKKEREEKERKRLAEVEAKNEEKRKKNEAKEEEIRKKEEERKRKEQEKEEAELKKKKAAQAFTKFFVPKAPSQTQVSLEEDSNTGDGTKLLAFRPFQVKGDMKLAPLCRKLFTEEDKCRLDALLGFRHKKQTEMEDEEEDIVRRKPLTRSQLYLSELRSGKILTGKWRRPSTESKDDVIIVEDDLERVGQAIVEDTPAYVREEMRVKLYKFHDNRRPPYYGTWRKKSSVIKPTKPFEQDKKFFDYEVDSDDEWEEEEPGESLEDGSDDDKEKESGDDDDYEVDNKWFVPHGHLSDEEMQNEDECGGMGDNNTREAQKAKLQILQQEFAQEMKKKTEKIKPRLIGCIWVDENGNQPTECAKIIWDTLKKKAMLLSEPPLVEELEVEKSTEPPSPSAANGNADKQQKSIVLSENMVKDLTRLIHGNNHSKNFLINEYLAFVEKTEDSIKNGDLRKPLKSVIRDKIDEMAEWQVVNATASSVQGMEQANDDPTDSTKKKKKSKRRLCWVVKQEVLDNMDLSSLELQNSWEYTLPPKFVKADKDVKTDETSTTQPNTSNDSSSATPIPVNVEDTKTKTNASQITKFTKVLTAEEKAKKLKNPTPPPSTPSSPSTTNSNIIENKVSTPTSKTGKEKKRVPLLMSVARGQQISTPAKNKLISQFLQKGNNDNTSKVSSSTSRASTRTNLSSSTSPTVEDDDIVILD